MYLKTNQPLTTTTKTTSPTSLHNVKHCIPTIERSPKRLVFGTRIDEHVRCIGRPLSIVIELSVHLLHKHGLQEEGLFRIPGSAIKIKKLKNAINAWFVTMASQGDLTVAPDRSSAVTATSATSSSATNEEVADQQNKHIYSRTLVKDSSTSLTLTSANTAAITHESGRGAMVAINNLFKEIASHKPRLFGDDEDVQDQDHALQMDAKTTAYIDTSTLKSSTTFLEASSATEISHNSQQVPNLTSLSSSSASLATHQMIDNNIKLEAVPSNICYDLPTIAGLLKLYLRDLPEPLFTFELYNEWITATVKSLNNQSKDEEQSAIRETSSKIDDDKNHEINFLCKSSTNPCMSSGPESQARSTCRQDPLEPILNVLEKLPRANYDNLAHLIKFLHVITNYVESNKMSASNLSITMAPSLIWAPPDSHHHNPDVTLSSDSGSSYNSSVTTIDTSSSTTNKNCIETTSTTRTNNAIIDNMSTSTDIQEQTSSSLEEQMRALNMQITSAGMSTSLNALVIENLIKNADKIFTEQVKFQVPFLDNQSQHQQQLHYKLYGSAKTGNSEQISSSKGDAMTRKSKMNVAPNDELSLNLGPLTAQDAEDDHDDDGEDEDSDDHVKRKVASVSPTGLSTTSSSSFSSGSSISHHNRTMLSDDSESIFKQHEFRHKSDPMSLGNQPKKQDHVDKTIPNKQSQIYTDPKLSISKQAKLPPPIPPLPKCKSLTSQSKKPIESNYNIDKERQQIQTRVIVKSPAPPLPDANPKQQHVSKSATNTDNSQDELSAMPELTSSQPRAISLRGTGTIPLHTDSMIIADAKNIIRVKSSNYDEIETNLSEKTLNQSTSLCQNSIRPSVPPPSRPERSRNNPASVSSDTYNTAGRS